MNLNTQKAKPYDDNENHARAVKLPVEQVLSTEKTKLLVHMFNAVCTVRLTASAEGYDFISYLLEMAALEVQQEIGLAKAES